MDPLAFLTDPVVAPFAGALAVMLLFFVVELLLTLLAGSGLAHLLGSLAESHWLPDASLVNWLLLKETPLMMVLIAAIGGFGLAGTGYQLTIDLEQCQVRDSQGLKESFAFDEASRQRLLEGLDEIDLILANDAEISAFEKQRTDRIHS